MIEGLWVGVPKHIVPRETSPALEKFERVTGIKKTRRTKNSTFGMICDLLGQIHKDRFKDISNLIVVTQSPDQLSPCCAVEVHDYLGLDPGALAFDVNHACDGWVVGLHLAAHLTGNTLLICADRLRYAPNYLEGLIFSDSVSATIISNDIWSEFKSITDGSKAKSLYCGLDGEMRMDGNAVFDFVTTKIPGFIKEFDKPAFLIPHQANLSMIRLLEKRTGIPTLESIEEYGNQSLNSIPTCLAYNETLVRDRTVLCVGFGAGFTAAGIRFRYPKEDVAQIWEIG